MDILRMLIKQIEEDIGVPERPVNVPWVIDPRLFDEDFMPEYIKAFRKFPERGEEEEEMEPVMKKKKQDVVEEMPENLYFKEQLRVSASHIKIQRTGSVQSIHDEIADEIYRTINDLKKEEEEERYGAGVTGEVKAIVENCKSKISRKTRVKQPDLMDSINHRTKGKSTVKYFTSGRTKRPLIPLEIGDSPYKYPKQSVYGTPLQKNKTDTRTLPGVDFGYQAPTVRTLQFYDIHSRVFVPPHDTSEEPLYAIDIDPEYFKISQGRPILRSYIGKKDLLILLQKIVRNKVVGGFVNDRMYLLLSRWFVNLEMLDEVSNRYDQTMEAIKRHVCKETNAFQSRFVLARNLDDAYEATVHQLGMIANCFSGFTPKLWGIQETLEYIRFCKSMCYQLSPTAWKQGYQEEYVTWKASTDKHIRSMVKLFKTYKKFRLKDDDNVDRMITSIIDILSTIGPLKLYFENPKDILKILKKLRERTLQAWDTRITLLKVKAKQKFLIHRGREYAKKLYHCFEYRFNEINKDIQFVDDCMNQYNGLIETEIKSTMPEVFNKKISKENTLVNWLFDIMVKKINRTYNLPPKSTYEKLILIDEMVKEAFYNYSEIPDGLRQELVKKVKHQKALALEKAVNAFRFKKAVDATLSSLSKGVTRTDNRYFKPLNPRSPPPKVRAKRKTYEEPPVIDDPLDLTPIRRTYRTVSEIMKEIKQQSEHTIDVELEESSSVYSSLSASEDEFADIRAIANAML